MSKTAIFLTDEEIELANAILAIYQIKLVDQLVELEGNDYRVAGNKATLKTLGSILTEVQSHRARKLP